MLWVKAFHIIFVVTWFAGLFYLPRLFVYHTGCEDEAGERRFQVMERKLFIITTVGGIGALGFGLILLAWWMESLRSGAAWLHLKLLLVAALIGYHAYLGVLMRRFRSGTNRHGARFFRIINEVPAVILVAVVILVVVKPF